MRKVAALFAACWAAAPHAAPGRPGKKRNIAVEVGVAGPMVSGTHLEDSDEELLQPSSHPATEKSNQEAFLVESESGTEVSHLDLTAIGLGQLTPWDTWGATACVVFSALTCMVAARCVDARSSPAGKGQKKAEPMSQTSFGLLISVFSTSIFSFASVLMKADKMDSGVPFPSSAVVTLRGLASLTLGVVACWLRGAPLLPPRCSATLARGACDAGATFCFYYGCTHLPLGLATVIHFTNPFWSIPLATAVLGEPCCLVDICIVVVGFLGMLVVLSDDLANPRISNVNAALVTLLGSTLQAANYAFGRLAVRAEGQHWTQAAVAFGIVSVPLSSCILYMDAAGQAALPEAIASTFLLADTAGVVACALTAQVLLVYALGFTPASLVAMIRIVDIPMAALWGLLFFDEQLTFTEVCGGVIIVGASCSLVWYHN
mmetsp:Transcript_102645/g.235501  ORF Transcript_102645/g.235501 Transcript_102645/m.235501 type:complete len:432 (+) Transcript_102645:72-1367(+)